MKKRVISGICLMSMLLTILSPIIPVYAEEIEPTVISESDIPLRLHYDEEAPYVNEDAYTNANITAQDGWEKWSLPVGNGYFGANVFGRTETERIQITEKTLSNPYYKENPDGEQVSLGGLNNFSETYIDIGHPFDSVTNYERWLDIKTAISGVRYDYEGVTYTREVFTSYPDKALVIRLDASEEGKLSFVLRPTVPWEQEYAAWEGDGASKEGQVVSYVDGTEGVVELSGKMGYYDIDFLGIYRVVTDGGELTATTCVNKDGETDGTITVSGASSAYVYVTLGTDYELTSEMFTTSDSEKPTFDTDLEYTRTKVLADAAAIASQTEGKSFEEAYTVLKSNHLNDYTEIFGRVTLDLGDSADAALTTDTLIENYKAGIYSRYLETLYFQYGRYLLIASSRQGTLPANLQGTWNRYNKAPWGSGIWHNINVQMNYWPAFSTNIAETFEAYVGYNAAYMAAAEANATTMVGRYNSTELGADGGNGWCIGTGAFPYQISGDRSAGNLGFTTQLFWEYYQYTQDKDLLENVVFPILVSAARYIVKTVELDENGNYLVSYCDSPEMHVNGVWYYTTGTTYAQSFAYQNNYNALLAAKELGIDLEDAEMLETEELCVFKKLMEQLDKYDPIIVGLSGQVKEFREEDYYASVADDPQHRHISQLVGLYPGNIINSNTPAWLDAAKVTLTERGDNATGWGIAHRLNLWARTKDGDRTYQVLNTLLTTSTATNLWDMHPPFQIDGNLGGTAGISEMLLQSHEGYIAPLAAIPSAWDSGSYTGLVARGNFEVSAAWADGIATTFNIKSKSGGEVSVYYGGITSAKVVRVSDGKLIDYSVTGTDLISFETKAGETYAIEGFKISEKLSAPDTLNVSRAGLGEINLSWSAVDGAVGYRVYAAIESQPDYELLGFTTDTAAEYIPKQENINARTTFKVVPVNSEGVEGEGAIAYINPIDVIPSMTEYEAYLFDSGELQVTVRASENTIKYKLWKKADGASEYSLVCESPYPIIIYDGYTEGDEYAVSLVSNALRTESELYELPKIKRSSEGNDDNAAKWYTNILNGKLFEESEAAAGVVYNSNYGYDKLTDGLYDRDESGTPNTKIGRFATKDNVDGIIIDGTVRFNNTHLLSEIRIYDFGGSSGTRIGDKVTVYALCYGEWKIVASVEGRESIAAARVIDTDKNLYYLPLSLSGIKAEAIRVVAENDVGVTQGISVYEITCSGAELKDELVYSENVLFGKEASSYESTSYYSSYDVSKLTDGSFDKKAGRFALIDAENNYVTVEYELDARSILDILKIYDYSESAETVSRVSSATVELYVNGEWVKYYDALPLLAPDESSSDSDGLYTSIPFYGVSADKIRITLSNTASTLGVSVYEIKLSGYNKVASSAETENILSGKLFTGDKDTISDSSKDRYYGYDKLTDGDFGVHTGRFAVQDETYSKVTLECDLGDVYKLYDLRIYDHADSGITRSTETTVEVYYCGEWVKLVDAQPLASGTDRLKDAQNKEHTLFALEGAKAEKIRITCYNSSGEKKGISLYEIYCSATKLSEAENQNAISDSISSTITKTEHPTLTESDNILLGKTFVANEGMTSVYSSTYGIDKLTDGIYNRDENGAINVHLGRFSSKSVANACLDATVTLDGTYVLSELRIYDFGDSSGTRIGDEVTVYALCYGEWITVATFTGDADVKEARVKDSVTGLFYVPIDMSGLEATAIRVYTKDTLNTSGITFYEITCSGTKLVDESMIETKTEALDSDQLSAITDGDASTVLDLGSNTISYSLEFDLGQVYSIYALSIRDVRSASDLVGGIMATRSNDTYIELYIDGEWIRIIDGASLSVTEEFTIFELYGLSASKIRIGFNNTQVFDDGTSPAPIISDVYCSVSGSAADKRPLLEAYASLPIIKDADDTYISNMQVFREHVTEFMLNESKLQEYVEQMTAYNATLLEGAHTAHDIKNYDAKSSTCTENGYYAYEACTLCDYTTYESILRSGHVLSDEWSMNDTQHYKECMNSGCEEKLEAADHTYDNDEDAICDCGYERALAVLSTPYGDIPAEYASVSNYPFVSFIDNGDGTYTFAKAEKDVFNPNSSMQVAARNVKTVIYMRRAYTVTEENSSSIGFGNYGWSKNVTYDLGGRVLTFEVINPFECKKEWDKYITFENGTIKGGEIYLFRFSGASTGVDYKYYITFNDIIFDMSIESKDSTPLLYFYESSYTHSAEVIFNNCTFDISGAIPDGGITLFPSGDASGKFTADIRINGGKIVTDTLSGVTLTSLGNDKSTVKFGKADGSFTSLYLKNTDVTLKDAYTGADSETLYFGKLGAEDVYTVYHLSDNVHTVNWNDRNGSLIMSEYYLDGAVPVLEGEVDTTVTVLDELSVSKVAWANLPETVTEDVTITETVYYKPSFSVMHNLSLYSDFKYNVYIPMTVGTTAIPSDLTVAVSIVIDGVTYEEEYSLSELEIYNGYYVASIVNIASDAVSNDIKITLKFTNTLGNAVEGTLTTSIIEYLKSGLKYEEEGSAGYNLYASIVAYAAASYDYFRDGSEELNALLSKYSVSSVSPTGTNTNEGGYTVLDTACLVLSSSPAFRFYLTGNEYPVTVSYVYNGKDVTLIIGAEDLYYDNGRYFFNISLRAYEFNQTINVSVGDESLSYNLADYYEGIKLTSVENKDKVLTLIEALNTYSVYAKEFKNKK